MCVHCYKDQMAMEPGIDETRDMFKKYREVRQTNEERDKDMVFLAQQNQDRGEHFLAGYQEQLRASTQSFMQPGASRKRIRTDSMPQ